MQPGEPEGDDYEYERQGVRNLFLAFEPLSGRREVKVREHRTKRDWAAFIRALGDRQYPQADKVVLVLDKLNTHTLSAL